MGPPDVTTKATENTIFTQLYLWQFPDHGNWNVFRTVIEVHVQINYNLYYNYYSR